MEPAEKGELPEDIRMYRNCQKKGYIDKKNNNKYFEHASKKEQALIKYIAYPDFLLKKQNV